MNIYTYILKSRSQLKADIDGKQCRMVTETGYIANMIMCLVSPRCACKIYHTAATK